MSVTKINDDSNHTLCISILELMSRFGTSAWVAISQQSHACALHIQTLCTCTCSAMMSASGLHIFRSHTCKHCSMNSSYPRAAVCIPNTVSAKNMPAVGTWRMQSSVCSILRDWISHVSDLLPCDAWTACQSNIVLRSLAPTVKIFYLWHFVVVWQAASYTASPYTKSRSKSRNRRLGMGDLQGLSIFTSCWALLVQ